MDGITLTKQEYKEGFKKVFREMNYRELNKVIVKYEKDNEIMKVLIEYCIEELPKKEYKYELNDNNRKENYLKYKDYYGEVYFKLLTYLVKNEEYERFKELYRNYTKVNQEIIYEFYKRIFFKYDKKYIKVLVENRKINNYKIKDYLYLANKKRPELELEEMYEKVCKE
jgi:hypothetical protein